MNRISKFLALQKNEQGYTLILTISLIFVISILALGLMGITATTLKQTDSERIDQATYYIAESGITQTKKNLDGKVYAAYTRTQDNYKTLSYNDKTKFNFEKEFYDLVKKTIPSEQIISGFEKNFGNTPEGKVNIRNVINSGPLVYTISSKGIIGDKRRTVSQDYTVKFDANTVDIVQSISNKYVVHVSDKFSLSGSGNVYGGEVAIASGNVNNVSIPDWYNPTPKVNYSTPIDIKIPDFPKERFASLEKLPYETNKKIELRGNDKLDLVMKSDSKYDTISLDNDTQLNINVGNSDKMLLVNNLDLSQGHINLLGSGKLTFYIKNQLSGGGSSTINNNTKDISKLKIFYKGLAPIKLTGAQKIYGSLHAETSDIEITAGAGFQGNIYTGGNKVSVSGGTNIFTQVFLAPNADFELTGGGNIKGSIISKTFSASGGTSVTYDPNNIIESSNSYYKEYKEPNQLTSLQGTLTEE